MKNYLEKLANALLGKPYTGLDDSEKKILNSVATKTAVSQNINESYEEGLSLGNRVADAVARFGGSWTFIGLFFLFIFVWILGNTLLFQSVQAFDPFPFILLNLGLSTLAAFQAPIIMMSQNRQSEKDRLKLEAAYEINLKLELEIISLHKKIDAISKQLPLQPEWPKKPDDYLD